MKPIYLILLLPLIIFAQTADKSKADYLTEIHNWSVDGIQGCILEIKGNMINFEEQWMSLASKGVAFVSKNDIPITLEDLKPPFMAEVSYYSVKDKVYIKSLRFLKQLRYDNAGYITE